MDGEWVRKPKVKTSVIFVHGILSRGETCWRHEGGSYWPELLKSEESLDALGIYVYTYQTSIFSGDYRVSDVVDDLKERMRLDEVIDSERIIFVCHSLGGIVVRKFLVERAADLIEKNIAIGLFLVASPSLGARYADWLSALAQLFGHSQADALRFVRDNVWLSDLDKEFQNLKEAGKLRIVGKELIEDKFIVFKRFFRTQVVERFSGARYFGEHYKVPQSDHYSIAKPASKDAIQHRLLRQFVIDMTISQSDKKPSQTPIEGIGIVLKSELIANGLTLAASGSEQTLNNVTLYFSRKLGISPIVLTAGNMVLRHTRIQTQIMRFWDTHTPATRGHVAVRQSVPVPVVAVAHGHSKGFATITMGIYDLYSAYVRYEDGKSSLTVQSLAFNNYAAQESEPQALADELLANLEDFLASSPTRGAKSRPLT